jgi:uncharacterized protein YqhQ
MLSLEDDVLRIFPSVMASLLRRVSANSAMSPVLTPVFRVVYGIAQAWVSKLQEIERRRLLHVDYQSRRSLSFSGESE